MPDDQSGQLRVREVPRLLLLSGRPRGPGGPPSRRPPGSFGGGQEPPRPRDGGDERAAAGPRPRQAPADRRQPVPPGPGEQSGGLRGYGGGGAGVVRATASADLRRRG